ncbi:hypothetical protein POM88_016882 [Heracleum sosnowskyi]|uniref:Uncharacterized protein n=1 Tax=Heracleum sosnowskyi TaxID=360622 RepID=A0AAD8IMH9_9APIA|nr:hypothetical protein POM88_016882 [Heracleum sosnowskyi]
MGQELAECIRGPSGQLGGLVKIITENISNTEEQAVAAGLLADLPERDMGLTRQMLDEGAFQLVISRVARIRQGETRGNRFMTPYLEGLVRVLARITFVLANEPDAVAFCQEHNLASVFTELLQVAGLDNVQMVSAIALENLSHECKNLTRLPESSLPGQALEKLVANLDHTNEKVVEASLEAMSTLLEDELDIENGVSVLCEVEAIRPILDVLIEKRTETLMRRAVWVVEKLLRTDDIAYEVSGDPNVSTALGDAFQHGDYRTRQIAEHALKHVDKIPNFSGIFPNLGQ